MKVAVLMDPIATLHPKKDTTLALMHKAIQLGHEVRYFTPYDWSVVGGAVLARTHSLKSARSKEENLKDYDLVLMRQNPPVDTEYLYATYMLSLLETQGVRVSNSPNGVREVHEKMGILRFGDWIPPTLVSLNHAQLHHFWLQHRDVIFKPLYGMGGEGVFHVDSRGHNIHVILEMLTQRGQRTIMAQRYIPAIKTSGDKRIVMIHGEPVPYALARMPAQDDFRGNLAAGATAKIVALTARDQAICQAVSPFLKEKGLDLVGLDIIGDVLTEINVTSPTCLQEISTETGVDVALSYWTGWTSCQ